MGKRKPQLENLRCRPGSPEQQLDMCENGELRGDEIEHRHQDHRNFHFDMAEEDREGDDMSGDEHSSGLQGGEQEIEQQEHIESGLPGDETIHEDLENRKKSAA